MAIVQERVVTSDFMTDVHWGAVIAGAVAAAALSFLLLAFGAGVGLAIASGSPTWRDTTTLSVVIAGAFLIFTALASFGLGGYVAGRVRPRLASAGATRELEFRDGIHGLLVWALAILMGAVIAAAGAQSAARLAVSGTGQAGASASVAGETTLAYELDELFRSDHPHDQDMTYDRAEASRILLTTSRQQGMSQDDRNYLVELVATRAHVSQQEADSRVSSVVPEAQQALKAVRESGVIVAFMTAAALMIGLVAAWLAAREGGREREIGGAPVWRWSLSRPVRM